jgi:hypothetical protein
MGTYDLDAYRLAGVHAGKWALTITLVTRDASGHSELPFHGGPEFGSEVEALRYGVAWVAARGGMVRRSILQAAAGS